MKQLINKIHYNKQRGYFILKSILFLASVFYLVFIKIKNYLYKISILKENKVDAFLICVGNLTTGGVGKTPLVCEISNHLAKKGKKVAIISRGYKGKLKNKNPNVIKNFSGIIINNPELTGDEPYMLASQTNNVAIITCKDRLKSAKAAIELGANYIVMDDGFSNRKLKKDLTLLLVDSEKQFGNKHTLPYGPLREPLSEIKRADKVIEIHKNNSRSELKKEDVYKKEIINCDFIKDYYYDIKTNEKFEPNKDIEVGAFCAIGQPEQFYAYVKEDFNLQNTYSFNDHHPYTEDEIKNISDRHKILITTQKDEVKLKKTADNVEGKIIALKLKVNTNIGSILNE